MTNSNTAPPENKEVSKISEENIHNVVDMYHGASMLKLEKNDMDKLSAAYPDEEYEIRPDGFIYIPQALIRKRLNDVVGIGQWSMTLFRDKFDLVKDAMYKVFYDGAMLIRGNFVSRSTGEATYNKKNPQQSWGSALEAAKSDCMVRCSKDLGIALEIYQPSFIRRWQKEYAIKVWVNAEIWEGGNKKTEKKAYWRRRDVDPFPNEIGPVVTAPVVPVDTKPAETGPRAITEQWQTNINACKSLVTLTALYNDNQREVDGWPELQAAFKTKQEELKKTKAA